MQKSVHTRSYKVLCERLVAARHAAGWTQTQLDLVEFLEIADALEMNVARTIRAIRKST
jgi:hypothetical protein